MQVREERARGFRRDLLPNGKQADGEKNPLPHAVISLFPKRTFSRINEPPTERSFLVLNIRCGDQRRAVQSSVSQSNILRNDSENEWERNAQRGQ